MNEQFVRVFFDSSVLISESISQKGASRLLLELADLSLLEGHFSPDVFYESERNLSRISSNALPVFYELAGNALTQAEPPTISDLLGVKSFADSKDAPILAAAVAQECHYLVTLNERDFWSPRDMINVASPGTLLQKIRFQIRLLLSQRDY